MGCLVDDHKIDMYSKMQDADLEMCPVGARSSAMCSRVVLVQEIFQVVSGVYEMEQVGIYINTAFIQEPCLTEQISS